MSPDGLPFLLRCRVREPTLARYRQVLGEFLLWLQAGAAASGAPMLLDFHHVDMALTQYAHSGETSRSVFTTLFAATIFFLPGLDKHVPIARAALKGWCRYLPPVHKVPMLFVYVVALAAHLVTLGRPRSAAGVLVQFGGFLRPGELTALRVTDVTLPEQLGHAHLAGAGAGILALGTAARGTKVNRQQVAKVTNEWSLGALRWLVHTAPGPQLLGVTYAEYRHDFAQGTAHAGFPALGLHFTPHCPRAGAATQGSLEGRSVPDLMDAGRWSNELSLKTYLDIAGAMGARSLQKAAAFQHFLADQRAVGPIFMVC